MTPKDEQLALRWIAARVRNWSCPECGGQWITTRSTRSLFHQCKPSRRTWTPPLSLLADPTNREERHRLLFDELLRAQGEMSIWRPIEGEEP